MGLTTWWLYRFSFIFIHFSLTIFQKTINIEKVYQHTLTIDSHFPIELNLDKNQKKMDRYPKEIRLT